MGEQRKTTRTYASERASAVGPILVSLLQTSHDEINPGLISEGVNILPVQIWSVFFCSFSFSFRFKLVSSAAGSSSHHIQRIPTQAKSALTNLVTRVLVR